MTGPKIERFMCNIMQAMPLCFGIRNVINYIHLLRTCLQYLNFLYKSNLLVVFGYSFSFVRG